MFQASRQLFHRTPASARLTGPDAQTKADDVARRADRHPAMRGLDVSPVHGRHCICARCEKHHGDAA